jgi:phosphatidylglycerol---prolipoprotein diacylglyceryl transferase
MIGAEPVFFFGLEVSWLGLGILLGSLAGAAWLATALPRLGEDRRYAWRLYPYVVVAGSFGAKLWAAIETLFTPENATFWDVITSRWGATFYGGLMLAGAAITWRVVRDGKSLWVLSTAIAPSLALGQSIGRIGCFLLGDDYGVPTALPWGMAFPHGAPPTLELVHPTQLYESAWLLGCALFLRARLCRSRLLIAEYLVLQGLGRFAIELVRTNPATVGPFTTSQLIAASCFAAGIIGLRITHRREVTST